MSASLIKAALCGFMFVAGASGVGFSGESEPAAGVPSNTVVFASKSPKPLVEDAASYGDISAEWAGLDVSVRAAVAEQMELTWRYEERLSRIEPKTDELVQAFRDDLMREPKVRYAQVLVERHTELLRVLASRTKSAKRRFSISGTVVDDSGEPLVSVTFFL